MLTVCSYARFPTPCDKGYHLGKPTGSSFRNGTDVAPEGSLHPRRRDCLWMSLVRSPHCVMHLRHAYLSISTSYNPTLTPGRSHETQGHFQIQRHSILDVGLPTTDTSEQTCISTHTDLAEGAARSHFLFYSDSYCPCRKQSLSWPACRGSIVVYQPGVSALVVPHPATTRGANQYWSKRVP